MTVTYCTVLRVISDSGVSSNWCYGRAKPPNWLVLYWCTSRRSVSGSGGQLVAAGGRVMSISTRSASENHGEHTLHWLTQDAADSLLAYLLVAARPSSVTQSLCDLQEGGCAAAGTAPLQSNYLTSVLVTTHYYCTLSSSMLSISR